jgi:hypothetical protein
MIWKTTQTHRVISRLGWTSGGLSMKKARLQDEWVKPATGLLPGHRFYLVAAAPFARGAMMQKQGTSNMHRLDAPHNRRWLAPPVRDCMAQRVCAS